MNAKIINSRDLINTEAMLSSSTYYANNTDCCVYCHNEVKQSEGINYNGVKYHPYRCSCKNSEHELFLKGEVLCKLKELEKLNGSTDNNIIIDCRNNDEDAMSIEYMREKERI